MINCDTRWNCQWQFMSINPSNSINFGDFVWCPFVRFEESAKNIVCGGVKKLERKKIFGEFFTEVSPLRTHMKNTLNFIYLGMNSTIRCVSAFTCSSSDS